MEIFAKRLKELRIGRKLTYTQLATELGVSDVALGRWERCLRIPNAVQILNIARYFGVSTDYLLGNEDWINISKQK